MPVNEFIWIVPVDHPAFAGHFPGRPIVPGVVLLDQALLFAAQYAARSLAGCTINAGKFLSPIGPGETLHFIFSTTPRGSIAFTIRGDGREVANGVFVPAAA